MHWASKVFVGLFLLHASILIAESYQLSHLKWPSLDELKTAEGTLIFEKEGRDWATGIRFDDGKKALFTCRLPGSKYKYCFGSRVIEQYGLDKAPRAIIWWYPLEVPLSDVVYPYVFQVQLLKDNEPFSFKLSNGTEFSYSYEYRGDRKRFIEENIKSKLALSVGYVLGALILVGWGKFKAK